MSTNFIHNILSKKFLIIGLMTIIYRILISVIFTISASPVIALQTDVTQFIVIRIVELLLMHAFVISLALYYVPLLFSRLRKTKITISSVLNNGLYLLGLTVLGCVFFIFTTVPLVAFIKDLSAEPVFIEAQLYKAEKIDQGSNAVFFYPIGAVREYVLEILQRAYTENDPRIPPEIVVNKETYDRFSIYTYQTNQPINISFYMLPNSQTVILPIQIISDSE